MGHFLTLLGFIALVGECSLCDSSNIHTMV
jgi:hypothetical protein